MEIYIIFLMEDVNRAHTSILIRMIRYLNISRTWKTFHFSNCSELSTMMEGEHYNLGSYCCKKHMLILLHVFAGCFWKKCASWLWFNHLYIAWIRSGMSDLSFGLNKSNIWLLNNIVESSTIASFGCTHSYQPLCIF